jgi:hypothetical protein
VDVEVSGTVGARFLDELTGDALAVDLDLLCNGQERL